MYSLNLSDDFRILSACKCLEGFEYENIVDSLPEGDISNYKYIHDAYVEAPLLEPEPEPESSGSAYVTYDEMAEAIREGVNSYGI